MNQKPFIPPQMEIIELDCTIMASAFNSEEQIIPEPTIIPLSGDASTETD